MQQRDFSREMIVSRQTNGVKLTKPQRSNADDGHLFRLGDLLDNPYSVYFYDAENRVIELNETCLNISGAQSRNEMVGKSLQSVSEHGELIYKIHMNNHRVMRDGKMLTVDEEFNPVNGEYSHAISFKFPWLDGNDELIGVFGCAVIVTSQNLKNIASQTAMIAEKFCATNNSLTSTRLINGTFFSAREMEVIQLIMRGKTVREVALQLGLSQRTVESYFSNIKLKLNVQTKSEFFEKMLAENL